VSVTPEAGRCSRAISTPSVRSRDYACAALGATAHRLGWNILGPVTIGASRNTAKTDRVDYLLGAIDEVACFNVALGADQIGAIHDAPDGECH
jgi:hypothetical protein